MGQVDPDDLVGALETFAMLLEAAGSRHWMVLVCRFQEKVTIMPAPPRDIQETLGRKDNRR